MLSNSLEIDVKIQQEEVKKPNQSSIVLVSEEIMSENLQQLVITLDNTMTPQNANEIAQMVFGEWKETFPLYAIQEAFAEINTSQKTKIYMTFNATYIFSDVQTRNITKTIVDLLQKEVVSKMDNVSDTEKGRVDFELREQYNYLKRENSELQMALQQSKIDELAQKESIGALRLELEKQQRSLAGLSESYRYKAPEISNSYMQAQDKMDDVNYRLRQSQQESLERQREIQRLQGIINENERYINNLQIDYDQLRESNGFQLSQYMEENETLKQELFNYKDDELNRRQEVQLIKAELQQIVSDTENIQEGFKQKVQLMQFENNELKTALNENQKFEDRSRLELLEATRELGNAKEIAHRLEKEKKQQAQEWELKYKRVSAEKDEYEAAFSNSQEIEFARNNELVELKNHLLGLEQNLRQVDSEKKQLEITWQNRLNQEENDRERLIKQAVSTKDQLINNKENEIKRLTDRLDQQKQLVDKLMANQSASQTIWQENYASLEVNYNNAKKQTDELDAEIQKLAAENTTLTQKITLLEGQTVTELPVIAPELGVVVPELDLEAAIVEIEAAKDEDLIIEVEEPEAIAALIEEVTYDDEDDATDSEYGYEDDESDDYDYDDGYDDDYNYEDDEDYDYEYHEVDDLVHYDPESIEDDVKELFSNKDESGKEKISKKDFAIYELYLDNLKDLVEQADGQDFKAFAETKLKKFNKFKKEFEDGVKSPSLFSRKYKLETGLANQMKAFVLISRHLSVLLDVELSDSDDYDYGYDYGYDDYEDDYDYDYEDDYDYDYEEEPKKSKKSNKKSKK